MTDTYPCLMRLLHWIIGLLIIGLLALGFYMSDLPNTPDKFAIYGLHKSLGIVVLGLVIVRVLTRLRATVPAPMTTHRKWEVGLAHAIHAVFYVSMIGMPLSGWAMSSAGGHPVVLFGIPLPPLVGEDKALGQAMRDLHGLFADVFVVTIGLHVAGALKHHFIDRDGTIARMLPGHRKDGGCTSCQCSK